MGIRTFLVTIVATATCLTSQVAFTQPRQLGGMALPPSLLLRRVASGQTTPPDSTAEIERAFQDALKRAARLRIAGDRLELSDETGKRVAVFTAGVQPPESASALQGRSWQLVKFQGGDGTTLIPDDPGKYTIQFDAGGQLTARIDCNRGRGTWTSTGPNQLQFGPMALTRAQCPPGPWTIKS